MVGEHLSPEFSEFAQLARYGISHENGQLSVASKPGGEIRYGIHASSSGQWVLTRAERSEEYEHLMSAVSLVDIERMLTTLVGTDARARLGLPHLARPFSPSQTVGGLRVQSTPQGTFSLVQADGTVLNIAFAREYGGSGAAGFSQVAGLSLQQIRDGFLQPDGGSIPPVPRSH